MRIDIPDVRPGQRLRADHVNRIADAATAGIIGGSGASVSSMPGAHVIRGRDPYAGSISAQIVTGINRSATTIFPREVVQILSVVYPGNERDRRTVVEIGDYAGDQNMVAVAGDVIRPGLSGRVAINGAVYVAIDPDQEDVADQGATPVTGLRHMILESDGALPVIYWDILGHMALIRLQPAATSNGGSGSQWQFIWNEGAEL